VERHAGSKGSPPQRVGGSAGGNRLGVEWLGTDDYDVARLVLQRGVALTYALAFVNVWCQFRPLLGTDGLLPAPRFLARTSFRTAPSIFRWRYSDRIVIVTSWLGIVIAASALVGVLDVVPTWAAMVGWLVLWSLYVSVVNIGQVFYAFGWESLLVEAGFTVTFLGNDAVATPLLTLVAVRWLVFRLEFGAGMIKMRGDPCWRDLTCLDHHHETQPMPGPTSRLFHLLPWWVHRIETATNHVAQLLAPWTLFLPQPVAGIGATIIILTQAYLMISGNYAWLNFLTLVLAFSAIPDSWFRWAGSSIDGPDRTPGWFGLLVIGFAAIVLLLSRQPLGNLFSTHQQMNATYNRFHLVNSYGAFGSITRHRREVIIEGTIDGEEWRAYEFKAKPGDPHRRPRQIAPYHLRLDWLMWFAALSPGYAGEWLSRLFERLLAADRAVVGLLANDPFHGDAPSMVRARLVDYRFTTHAEHRRTGDHWHTGSSRVLVRL
jgi:hypothetical protein